MREWWERRKYYENTVEDGSYQGGGCGDKTHDTMALEKSFKGAVAHCDNDNTSVGCVLDLDSSLDESFNDYSSSGSNSSSTSQTYNARRSSSLLLTRGRTAGAASILADLTATASSSGGGGLFSALPPRLRVIPASQIGTRKANIPFFGKSHTSIRATVPFQRSDSRSIADSIQGSLESMDSLVESYWDPEDELSQVTPLVSNFGRPPKSNDFFTEHVDFLRVQTRPQQVEVVWTGTPSSKKK